MHQRWTLGIELQHLPGPDGWLGVGVDPLIDGDFFGFRDNRLGWLLLLSGDIFDEDFVVIQFCGALLLLGFWNGLRLLGELILFDRDLLGFLSEQVDGES